MKTITVHASQTYPIWIGRGLLGQCGTYLKQQTKAQTAAVITDDHVDCYYGDIVTKSLEENGFRTIKFVFPHGEASKCSKTLNQIYDFLCENNITRTDCLVALGGGVVGDITGFAAATYLRGLDYLQIPTSLLAQVDSSLGGKTASEKNAAKLENVTDYTEKLRKIVPEGVRIAMLHGRMKNDEKDAVMKHFKEHETDILISTTVVEVGVDVPNATVMMIENAERFGLAELHQLRGRVGRGEEQSYCIMINTSDSEKAAERLGILNNSNDGFQIAEEDLRLRGPGDVFGVRQSGDIDYRIADIYRDAAIMKDAAAAVKELMDKDPELDEPEHQRLRRISDEYLEKGYIV